MAKQAHTPGPWKQHPREPLSVWGNNQEIAHCSHDETGEYAPPKAQAVANASLIAAAPDLLLALQQIDLAPLSHGDDAINEMQRIARAAIAKTQTPEE